MDKLNIEAMVPRKIDDISSVYKSVFSGHPWHEDLICKNVLEDKCSTQYTYIPCETQDESSKGEIINDCREGYVNRVNRNGKQEIVLLTPGNELENCVGCGEKLETISFYPEYRNHNKLIEEALSKRGFTGYLARNDKDELVGFSWGYLFPESKTISVNFPILKSLLEEQDVDLDKCFYAAETGIIGSMQREGIGSVISGMRLLNANSRFNPQTLVTRTLNPAVHAYFTKAFSGVPAEELFKDPESNGSWFKWNFKDFDLSFVQEKVANAIK